MSEHLPDSSIDFEILQRELAGSWSIERELGRGGMGVVYLARDVALDRPVAIKVLHPELVEQADARERFLAEARLGARLSHPHIVPIYAVEQREGVVFFVMGLVDGESLGAKVRREGPLHPNDALRVIREVAWALGYAHASGLLHRDVTLDNVLIERRTGRAVLVDFGIAGEIEHSGSLQLIGTPAYIAPELIQGEAPSIQSDIYALGVTSWAMLAGRLPLDGEDSAATLVLQLTAPVPSLAKAAPATPGRVVRAIEACLAKLPSDRPEDAELFVHALEVPGQGVTLAPALDRWVARGAKIRPAWAFAAPLAGMLTIVRGLHWRDDSMISSWSVLLVVFGGTALVHAAFEMVELRRVALVGYRGDDLALAMQRRRRSIVPTPAPLLGRVIHDMGALALLGMIAGMVASSQAGMMLLRLSAREHWSMVTVVIEIIGWCWMMFWTAVGAEFVVQCHPITAQPNPTRGERFWRSAPGRAVARLAGWRTSGRLSPERTLHRPTEVMLGLAIDDLWAALPAAARATMADLPRVASGLRTRVAELREVIDTIDHRPAAGADVRAIRQRLADRHGAGVNALERIRLLMARLGTATAPAGELTARLDDARAVEQAMLAELGAHHGLLKQLKSRARTPALTPTPAGA